MHRKLRKVIKVSQVKRNNYDAHVNVISQLRLVWRHWAVSSLGKSEMAIWRYWKMVTFSIIQKSLELLLKLTTCKQCHPKWHVTNCHNIVFVRTTSTHTHTCTECNLSDAQGFPTEFVCTFFSQFVFLGVWRMCVCVRFSAFHSSLNGFSCKLKPQLVRMSW